ncbi:tetratricopeptide repeat protein [Acrocarpospora sp. B8E8]|uniref:tetratricopeptide repeat protein n=1 Tax=Acrocarpospora sp. B8E8 TaxID=3153572 RepID=UPI00325EBD53
MTSVRENPYVGLRAFAGSDREVFFGRGRESRELSDLWRSNRLVVLYGPSGIGKSSLLHAGTMPLLEDDHLDILPTGRASPGTPFPTPSHHNPYTFCLLSSWSPADSPGRLSELTVSQFLRSRPRRTDRYGDDIPVFAAIDQFEEVLNSPSPWRKHREAFLDQLGDATKEIPNLRLLVSIREDAIAELLPREADLAGHSRARLRLSPLSVDAALSAVTGPLAGTARRFAPQVAEQLVRDLSTVHAFNVLGERRSIELDSVEPWQIQIVCAQLWDDLPADTEEITLSHIDEYGDVAKALTSFCARMVKAVADDHGIPEEVLRKWLYDRFVTEHGTRGTAYEGLSETGGMPNEIAQALERRRVLRAEERAGSRWYELQHDRLIEAVKILHDSSIDPDAHVPTGPTALSGADFLKAAESALATGEFMPAEKYALEALRRTSDADGANAARTRAETLSLLGNLAQFQNQPDVALTRFRQAAQHFEALQLPSAVARLLSAVAKILIERQQFGPAIDELQAAVARLPSEPSIKRELANALWAIGQLNPAIAIFNSVLTVTPDDPAALVSRGRIRAEREDAAAALEDLLRAAELNPTVLADPAVRAARALALAGVGRLDDAAIEARIATSMGPNHGPALLAAAQVAKRMGDQEQSYELARRATDASSPQLFPHEFVRARTMLFNL